MSITSFRNLRWTFIALLVPALFFLAGCANVVPGGPPIDPMNFTGDWLFSAVSASSTNTNYVQFALGGLLSANQGTMTGLMQVLNPYDEPCLSAGTILAFTGTVQSDGTFSMSSTSVKGQTLSISGSIGSDYVGAGTGVSPYTITGNCQDSGKSLGTKSSPLNGSYTGAANIGGVTPAGPTAFQASVVTATFQESETANNLGEFPLNGSLSFQGSPCMVSVTMDPKTSYIIGGGITATLAGTDNSGKAVTLSLSGEYTNNAVVIYYSVASGSCSGETGSAEIPLNGVPS